MVVILWDIRITGRECMSKQHVAQCTIDLAQHRGNRSRVLFNPLPTKDAYICVMGVLTSSIRLLRINLYGGLTLDANTLYVDICHFYIHSIS